MLQYKVSIKNFDKKDNFFVDRLKTVWNMLLCKAEKINNKGEVVNSGHY